MTQCYSVDAPTLNSGLCAVEGEVDRAVIPPLPGHSINGPLWLSIFGKMPLVDIPALQIVIADY